MNGRTVSHVREFGSLIGDHTELEAVTDIDERPVASPNASDTAYHVMRFNIADTRRQSRVATEYGSTYKLVSASAGLLAIPNMRIKSLYLRPWLSARHETLTKVEAYWSCEMNSVKILM
jgi:hypothetical protein